MRVVGAGFETGAWTAWGCGWVDVRAVGAEDYAG